MQKHLIFVIIESPQNNKTKECFCMINYSRLGYEIKRDFTNFSLRDSVMHNYLGLVRQQVKDDYAVMRWRIEEYFRFKKQQFEMEDLRVMSLQSIRNLNLLAMLAVGYISLTTSVHKDSIFLAEIKECSKRIYGMPQFVYLLLCVHIGIIILSKENSKILGRSVSLWRQNRLICTQG